MALRVGRRSRQVYGAPPAERFGQAELRERRRRGRRDTYGAQFSLHTEVDAICGPLAERVAAEPTPARYLPFVDRLADATHELVIEAIGVAARLEAEHKARHLKNTGQAGDFSSAVAKLVDLAERPVLPEVTADDLRTGQWSSALVDLARPHSGRLSWALGRAKPPGTMRGLLSASEKVERQLREVDGYAYELSRRVDVAVEHRRQWPDGPPGAGAAARHKADADRAELSKLGIEVDA
jgi:hypothetical protein